MFLSYVLFNENVGAWVMIHPPPPPPLVMRTWGLGALGLQGS